MAEAPAGYVCIPGPLPTSVHARPSTHWARAPAAVGEDPQRIGRVDECATEHGTRLPFSPLRIPFYVELQNLHSRANLCYYSRPIFSIRPLPVSSLNLHYRISAASSAIILLRRGSTTSNQEAVRKHGVSMMISHVQRIEYSSREGKMGNDRSNRTGQPEGLNAATS